MSVSRRRFIQSALATLGTCSLPTRAALDCAPSTVSGNDLIIDVHCHIFNADDLAVRGFANHVYFHTTGRGAFNIGNWFASALDALGQATAPGVKREAELLEAILQKQECSVDRYRRVERPHTGILAPATNYRLHNAMALMETFPQVALFAPAMVDMDAHLGDRALVTLRQQVDLMEMIFAITGGRFHGYAAFDPLRQARYDDYGAGEKSPLSPLNVVKRAIEEQGFVGVKLYPPMGFRPLGNGELAKCVADEATRYYLGKYDAVLMRLFDWCAQNDVPVIAHCNDSNYAGVHDAKDAICHELGTPGQWAQLVGETLKRYSGDNELRVDMGHFGRADLHVADQLRKAGLDGAAADHPYSLQVAVDETETAEFLKAMKAYPANLYADLSNYDTLRDDRLRAAFRGEISKLVAQNPHLASQLMYGTDWFMNMQEANPYLTSFQEVIDAAYARNFFGGNAARYLGLARGRPTRRRLEKFYDRWNLKTAPRWMQLVDALG